MMSRTWRTEPLFLSEPDVAAWVAASRLNLVGALSSHADEPSVQAALGRYLAYLEPAVERLLELDGRTSHV